MTAVAQPCVVGVNPAEVGSDGLLGANFDSNRLHFVGYGLLVYLKKNAVSPFRTFVIDTFPVHAA